MNKKKLCFVLIFSFLLTGCSGVSLSQTESGQVSEYIAYSLLKFNKNPDMLITTKEENKDNSESESQMKPEQTANVEESKNPASQLSTQKPAKEQEEKNVTAGDVFGNSALSITVTKSGFYANYLEDDTQSYFSLSAEKGKKLLVIDLKVKNTSSKAVKFKTNSAGMSYSVSGSQDKALTTLLENDIHFFNTTIKPGKSVDAKLVYQVDEKYDLDTCKIKISNSDKSVELPVK